MTGQSNTLEDEMLDMKGQLAALSLAFDGIIDAFRVTAPGTRELVLRHLEKKRTEARDKGFDRIKTELDRLLDAARQPIIAEEKSDSAEGYWDRPL